MSNQVKKQISSYSYILTLVIILAYLKITGYLYWGWIWIFAPAWLVFLSGVITVIAGFFIAKYMLLADDEDKVERRMEMMKKYRMLPSED